MPPNFIPPSASLKTLSTGTTTPSTMQVEQTRQVVTFSISIGITLDGDFLVSDVSVPTLSSMRQLKQGYTLHLGMDYSYIQRCDQKAALHHAEIGLLRPTILMK
jgi:hypothetical protein